MLTLLQKPEQKRFGSIAGNNNQNEAVAEGQLRDYLHHLASKLFGDRKAMMRGPLR